MTRHRRRAPGATTTDGYGAEHRAARAAVLAGAPPCHRCGAPATQADHVPPLDWVALTHGLDRRAAAALYVTDGTGPYRLLPACSSCNAAGGRAYALTKRRLRLPTSNPKPRPGLNRSRQW